MDDALTQSESISDFRLKEMARLMSQRDEVVSALQKLLSHFEFVSDTEPKSYLQNDVIAARAAIKKATD